MIAWVQLHPLIILLCIGTTFTFFWLLKHHELLKLKWYTAVPVAIAHTLWGIGCVKLFAFMESGFNPDSAGNMSLFGGVFFMPVFYWILSRILKIPASKVFDLCTVCMIFTVMCARINCIYSGCCYGTHIGNTQARWPTRETEIIFYIVLMVWMIKKLKQGNTNGTIYPVYMMTYGIFRFILEFFRFYSVGSIFHPAHLWAFIAFCIGFSIYVQFKSNIKITEGRITND